MRWALLALFVVGAIACSEAPTARETSASRKVILLSVDTLRADVLTPYTPEETTTPNLNAFADGAVLFEDVVAQAPSTAISHKSILYSLYPAVHKTSKETVPQESLTSPIEAMQAAGMATAAFVDGGQLHEKYGFGKGFDIYRSARKGEKGLERLRTDAVAWLEEHGDEDFFLFLHTYQVHAPYAPPEPYRSRFAGWYEGDLPVDRRKGDFYVQPGSDEQRIVRDLYRGEVAYVDDFLKDLLADLDRLGLGDEVIFVFTSDHGESLGETGFVGHNGFLQEQLAIPLIVRIPGTEPQRISYPVEAVDIMPTLFNQLKLEPPYTFQGYDLSPLMAGRSAPDTDRSRFSEQAGTVAVQEGRHKAVFRIDGEGPALVYDLATRPEVRLQAVGELRDKVGDLRENYDRRMGEADDLAARFLVDGSYDPTLDADVREQLEALGYVN